MIKIIGTSQPISNLEIVNLNYDKIIKTKIMHPFLESISIFKDSNKNLYHSSELYNNIIPIYKKGDKTFGMT